MKWREVYNVKRERERKRWKKKNIVGVFFFFFCRDSLFFRDVFHCGVSGVCFLLGLELPEWPFLLWVLHLCRAWTLVTSEGSIFHSLALLKVCFKRFTLDGPKEKKIHVPFLTLVGLLNSQ